MRSLAIILFLLPITLFATEPTASDIPTLADSLPLQTKVPSPNRATMVDEITGKDLSISNENEEVVRLQIFLDQQNFGPGVIDGKSGTYTKMAIEAYNKKFGHEGSEGTSIKEAISKQTLTLYATAIVPSAATQFVDASFHWGHDRNYQATRKDMPYRSIAEFMAERYHTTVDFLKLINGAALIDNAKVRTAMRVPNISPFRIEDLAHGRTYKSDPILSKRWAVVDTKQHQIRIYEPLPPIEQNSPDTASPNSTSIQHNSITPPDTDTLIKAVIVEDDPEPEQQLSIHDEHRAAIVAAFPITPGKPQFIRRGTWVMKNSIEFPTWRFDDSLLKTGQRSNVSLTIPAGPNNPVGVHWMGLSRKGIGIHGTDSPQKIGRGRSAGCIRMANWDVIKLPKLLRPGATVIIK